ncbi:MAG: thiosulfate reductase cytochrome b subunit [Psychromonas sp.]|jgi:thiosulfate reductase cytochrome b subunit|uniref:cytochrome b/b6 domain-containing protein n=1 Tax=Psychromonas sp. TaxID=1884585 RepID=UPI0039E70CCC
MSNTKSSKIVVIFKRFERFWHWAQALMILILLLTGLELHGLFQLFGFAPAVAAHNLIGFVWTGLVVLIYSWILTTGEWQQYFPTLKGVEGTLRYYFYGVFKGEKHPHHMTVDDKFNPLQRLGYIAILFGLLPLQVLSGFAFYFFPDLRTLGVIGQVDLIAIFHTFNAYALLSFVVIHLYMITFGEKLSTHIKAMITGKEKIEE